MPNRSRRPARRRAHRTGRLVAAVAASTVVAAVVVAALTAGAPGPGSPLVRDPGPLTVTGAPLAPFEQGVADAAVGATLPTVSGRDLLTGEPLTIGPSGVPTLVIVGAAWCEYCNRDLPIVATRLKTDPVDPADVRVVLVSSWTASNTPHWPADEWLTKTIRWPEPIGVLADNEDAQALAAFGVTGLPAWIVVDRDGTVVARAAGAVGTEGIAVLLERVAAL